MRAAFAIAVFVCVSGAACAQDDGESKLDATIWRPTPREQRREMSADRPDVTESPYTVDAGAVQLELSFLDYARNGDAESWSVLPMNLKVGLLNDVDLQLVLAPYLRGNDGQETIDGFGDTEVRLKVNLWGNDGGKTAFALMPFVKAPTGSGDLTNDRVEGGVILPLAISVSDRVGLGFMLEGDFVYDDADGGYDTEFVTTGVVGFDVTDRLGAYVELVGIASTDSAVDYRGVLGAGATYAVDQDTTLDAGINIGLTGDADNLNLFSGITIRF